MKRTIALKSLALASSMFLFPLAYLNDFSVTRSNGTYANTISVAGQDETLGVTRTGDRSTAHTIQRKIARLMSLYNCPAHKRVVVGNRWSQRVVCSD